MSDHVTKDDIHDLLGMYDNVASQWVRNGIGQLVRSAVRQYCPPVPRPPQSKERQLGKDLAKFGAKTFHE